MKLNKKTLHRVAATMLATAMLACTALTGVAADGEVPTANVPTTGNQAPEISEGKISWTSTLDMSNAAGASVPNLKVTYTVGPVADGVTAGNVYKTGDKNQPTIYYGVFPASQTSLKGEATFAPSSTNPVLTTIDFAGVTFAKPGIYRYKVTNDWATQTGNGTNSSFDVDTATTNPRYLDVYAVEENEAISVKYAVLLTSDEDIHDVKNETITYLKKTDDYSAKYQTAGFTVLEQIGGPMGNKDDEFKYEITFTASDYTEEEGDTSSHESEKITIQVYDDDTKQTIKYEVYFDKNGVAELPKGITLGHSDKITVTGLPNGTKYQIVETVTNESGYDVSVQAPEGTITVNTEDETKELDGQAANAPTSVDIIITNERDAINPTGVLTDIAPYAAMVLVAAAAGVVFSRRRREQD